MLINKKNIAVFIILFCLSSLVMASDTYIHFGSSNSGLIVGTDKITDQRNLKPRGIPQSGSSTLTEKLQLAYKQKRNRSEALDYEQIVKDSYTKNHLEITENSEDDNTKDKVFEFYPSIQDDNFINSSETKNSDKQLYKF